jgi:hypothetical protein
MTGRLFPFFDAKHYENCSDFRLWGKSTAMFKPIGACSGIYYRKDTIKRPKKRMNP